MVVCLTCSECDSVLQFLISCLYSHVLYFYTLYMLEWKLWHDYRMLILYVCGIHHDVDGRLSRSHQPSMAGPLCQDLPQVTSKNSNAVAPDREVHREEMNRNERFLSSMSILPWNCLVAGLNIHTFDWHCRKDTSNWILITERIPFGKQDGDRQVDPAYDKMKDTLLISCPVRDMFHWRQSRCRYSAVDIDKAIPFVRLELEDMSSEFALRIGS